MSWSVVGAIVLVVVGGIAALRAGLVGVDFMGDLEQTRSPLARSAPAIVDAGTPRLARRVAVVIVDGLRRDKSVGLPYLDKLRAAGVDAVAVSHYPTWSRPNYVSILTGVPPQASGVRTNRHHTPVQLDSLMDRARAGGLAVAVTADNDALPALFLRPPKVDDAALEAIDIDAMREPDSDEEKARRAPDFELVSPFDDSRYTPWPGGFAAGGRAQVAGDAPLLVLLIGAVDVAGHAHGADSDEYVEATFIADRAVARVISGLDLKQDAVIVVADHGHTTSGGHGGIEREVMDVPLVAAGAGIRPGAVIAGARLIDVAPTAAALLGLPAPGHGLGRTLTGMLALDDAQAAARARADETRLAQTERVVAAARSYAEQVTLEKRALRIGLVVAFGAIASVLMLWLRRVGGARFAWRTLLIGAPAFVVVYYTIITVLGQRFSPSFLPARGHISWELAKYGGVAIVAQIGVVWFVLRRRRHFADRLAAANGIAFVGLMLTMIPAGLVWAFFPAPYNELPGPRMLVMIPAVQVAVACYALAIALGLVVEVVVFFARAVDPRVRIVRLERAIALARAQLADGTGPRRRRRRPRFRREKKPRPAALDDTVAEP
jgi:hypothetical protein